jgi:hypothetical protein
MTAYEECADLRPLRCPSEDCGKEYKLLIFFSFCFKLHLGSNIQLSAWLWKSQKYNKKNSNNKKNVVFWDMAPCGYCKNRCFGGACRLHVHGRRNNASERYSLSGTLSKYITFDIFSPNRMIMALILRNEEIVPRTTMISTRRKVSDFFFLWIPFYLQAVQIHSANGVKLLEAWRGVLSSTPPYK